MSKAFNIKGSRFNKFMGGNKGNNDEIRKNILITPALHQMIRDVVIEEETSLKGFASDAIDKHIEKVAGMGSKPCFEKTDAGTVATTVFLPRDLAKEIKRTANHAKISENELMVRCLVAGLKTMKNKYPEIIIDTIIK